MGCRRYTDEERSFFVNFVHGHSHREILEAFNQRFENPINLNQVKAYIKNNHLNTGRTGRYEKGRIPENKGKKGYCAQGCEKSWFTKGHIPKNYRPVGSERISKDGYVEIKVAEPNKWMLKHRVVWIKHNGEVPKGYIVVFRDGDKTNTDINNLILISRSAHAVMNHTDLHKFTGGLKESAVYLAELKINHGKAKKRKPGNKI